MQVIDHTGALDDLWPAVEEGPLPDAGRALVPLARLDEALASGLELGVRITNDADLGLLEPALPRLAMIAVDFPSFADGRGFSIAKRLRRMGFVGRLRAVGPVIADQFAYLLTCGFDEVAIPSSVADRQPVESFLAESKSITLGYQRGLWAGSILDRRMSAAQRTHPAG